MEMRSPAARDHADGDLKYRQRNIVDGHYSGVVTVAAVWLAFYLLAFGAAIWTVFSPGASEITAQYTVGRSQALKSTGSIQPPAESHTVQIRH
jgi:hypothetical protein